MSFSWSSTSVWCCHLLVTSFLLNKHKHMRWQGLHILAYTKFLRDHCYQDLSSFMFCRSALSHECWPHALKMFIKTIHIFSLHSCRSQPCVKRVLRRSQLQWTRKSSRVFPRPWINTDVVKTLSVWGSFSVYFYKIQKDQHAEECTSRPLFLDDFWIGQENPSYVHFLNSLPLFVSIFSVCRSPGMQCHYYGILFRLAAAVVFFFWQNKTCRTCSL